MDTENHSAVKEQIRYYVALKKFLFDRGAVAFTDTFEDLYGLKQLPGLAVQMLMNDGIGFGAEGDWKTAALDAVMMNMAKGKEGATGFMEDYTYDFERELVLGAHMLEVSEQFAATKPKIKVEHLGIGGKEPPARLVFDGITGNGIACSLIDLGGRFRLIVAKIELVKQPKEMPHLPVGRIMWKLIPDFKSGAKAWIMAGGAHHTVVSTALTVEDMRDFAEIMDIECVVIDENYREVDFINSLRLSEIYYKR